MSIINKCNVVDLANGCFLLSVKPTLQNAKSLLQDISDIVFHLSQRTCGIESDMFATFARHYQGIQSIFKELNRECAKQKYNTKKRKGAKK
jgi:hypothetical protein